MNNIRYALDEYRQVVVTDKYYRKSLENAKDWRVDETFITSPSGDEHRISTVFLGTDHSHVTYGPPVLFETMVFCDDDKYNNHYERCCTWEGAEAMHRDMVRLIEGHINEEESK